MVSKLQKSLCKTVEELTMKHIDILRASIKQVQATVTKQCSDAKKIEKRFKKLIKSTPILTIKH